MEKKDSKLRRLSKKQFWLEPTAAALAKLEEIQSSVECMKPASAFNVQSVWHPAGSTPTPPAPVERSPSIHTKPSPYTELETEPPLSTVNIQKTAWGSNSSIPDLIKAQGERQKLKGAPRRPWSGRKVPSSPTTQRKNSQSAGDTLTDCSPGAFIAVTGAKSVMYDVGSRPPSGRSHQSTSSTSSTFPHTSSHDVFEMMEAANTVRPVHEVSTTPGEDNSLEEFLRCQPNGHKHELSKLSAAFADERNITPPPPPPCASPDLEKLINGGLDEKDGLEQDHSQVKGCQEQTTHVGEVYIKQPSHVPPQLLRRPTPEPLKLSMTIPVVEGNEEYSTDEDSFSGVPSPQLSPDIELQSVTSEVSAHFTTQFITSQQNSPTHCRPVTPQGVDSTIAQSRGDGSDLDGTDVSVGKSRKVRQSVKIVEERNETFDITPRESLSISHRPSPPSNRKVQRPRSALKSLSVGKSIVQKKRPSSASSRDTRQLTKGNSSSTGRFHGDLNKHDSSKDRDEEQYITEDDIMDAINNNGMSQLIDNLTQPRRQKGIETMMSQLDVFDDVSRACTPDEVSKTTHEVPQSSALRTVQVSSSTKQNYYERAIQAKKKSMYHRQNTPTLTNKVIEFGDEGPSMETQGVSYFQVVTPPSQVKPSRPTSSRGPRRGWEESNNGSHVIRPTMEKKSFVEQKITRPTSRLGSYQDLESSEPCTEQDKTISRSTTIQRARPRSAILKAKHGVSPHRCAVTNPNSTKPRPHSSFVNSNPPKKLMRRNSSPSGQTHSNSNKALVPTVRKSKAEIQRNREAVRALKDGSLKKVKTYGKQIVGVEDNPSVGRALKKYDDGDKGSDSDSIDEYPKSMREEEIFNLHRHLTRSGVKISYKTLKRGLVAPNEKNINQCIDQLPSNVSLNLLSKPESWLGETYQKYLIAENALRRAETQIAIQEEKVRLEAEKLKQSMKGASGKKKKKKGAKKRSKSPASNRSCLSSAKSGVSMISSRSKVAENDRPVSAISALGLDTDEVLKDPL